ncbi:MAG TPA: GNAT family N-acetyltransferase [Ktedonobacterales bacterium]
MALENAARLARAVEANWCAAWASLGGVRDLLPTLVDDTAGYVRVCTPGIPELLLNTVLRYSGPVPVAAADLERVIAPYRRHHLPFQWWLTLGEEPRGLREQLYRLQLLSYGGTPCMALDLDGWVAQAEAADVAAQETTHAVSTPDEARAALEVICHVFDVPPGPMARWTVENPRTQLYLTRRHGQAVSALATFRDGESVGISNVATLFQFRRRGSAGRLLIHALREAQAAGARLATLTATPEAQRLYESLGFRTCGMIEQWVPSPELMARLTGARSPRAYSGVWW